MKKKSYKPINRSEEIDIRSRVRLYEDHLCCEFCKDGADDGLKLNAKGNYFYICFRCLHIVTDEATHIKEKFLTEQTLSNE